MTAAEFLSRARREALRYGSDPWVFVRELVQNSRDAYAQAVAITAIEADGRARVVFSDDGEGMDFAHARRYLFALYASSKDGERGAAGRFGVGFWSLLRFEPTRIVIRSWPRRVAAWEVELDGALSHLSRRTPAEVRRHGTEIVLERPSGDGRLARRVRDAAGQSVRYACQRGARLRPLDVRVNGVSITAPFELPPPSSRFRKGRVRGLVALGPEARVELLAQGLRVRSASALEDLLRPDGASTQSRVRFPTLADGLAPQALLDGEDFEPLLARADVRETPALRKLVALGQDELRHLVERQLDAVRPPPLAQRVRRMAGLAAALALLAGAIVLAPRLAPPSVPTATPEGPSAYRDLRDRYRGPQPDVLPESRPLALRYEPADARLYFSAMHLESPFAPAAPLVDAGEYRAPTCSAGCVEVRLWIDDGPGPLRLLVPTGHRLDAASVRLGRQPALGLRVSAAGEPFVILQEATQDILAYRTGPDAEAPRAALARPATPERLGPIVERLRLLEPPERIAAATAWVGRNVRYSTSPEVIGRYRAQAGRGDLLSSALAVGAGDCDVQNAILTTLLQAADLPARLAVGYVGNGGAAVSTLHAWAEVRAGDGPWQVADASLLVEGGDARAPVAANTGTRSALAAAAPAALPPRDPHPSRGTGAPHIVAWRRLGWALVATCLAGVAALALRHALTRTRREVHVAPEQDVAALLRGALERPDAFREAPALYERRLLPTVGGRAISLAEASQWAQERRLFRSANGSPLARRTASDGAAVLDASQRESAAAADGLAAVDLDEWDAFLGRSRKTPLFAAVDRRLRALGLPWDVRTVPGSGAAAVLDLPTRGGTRRIVVLDAEEPRLQAAEARRTRPCEAVLAVVDALADVLELPLEERRRVLAPLARDALREAAS